MDGVASSPLVFVRCGTCTHAGLARRASGACRMCGGEVVAVVAPPPGFRCACFQCTWTPC